MRALVTPPRPMRQTKPLTQQRNRPLDEMEMDEHDHYHHEEIHLEDEDEQEGGEEKEPWYMRAPIPATHPLKITWDILTILLSLTVGAYTTHAAIRDRNFLHHFYDDLNLMQEEDSNFSNTEHENNANGNLDMFSLFFNIHIPLNLLHITIHNTKYNIVAIFIECWFTIDMILNFFTEHTMINGKVIREGRAVKMRYLTTWFAVDALSLVPWERVLVQPIIEMQNRRNIFKKTFFKSKAVLRVTPKVLRNFRKTNLLMFGRVAKQTGWGSRGLIQKMIKYIPKYLLFYRNMKGALAIRLLRQIHWFRKIFKLFTTKVDQKCREMNANVLSSASKKLKLDSYSLLYQRYSYSNHRSSSDASGCDDVKMSLSTLHNFCNDDEKGEVEMVLIAGEDFYDDDDNNDEVRCDRFSSCTTLDCDEDLTMSSITSWDSNSEGEGSRCDEKSACTSECVEHETDDVLLPSSLERSPKPTMRKRRINSRVLMKVDE